MAEQDGWIQTRIAQEVAISRDETRNKIQLRKQYVTNSDHVACGIDSDSPPGLPLWTIAGTVSSELLGFCFYFFLIFSFLGRVLD